MRRGHLSEYFSGVVVKKLSAVETSPASSNQHEFNSSSQLKRLLGEADRRNIPTQFIWIGQEQEAISAEGIVSWYDARRRHPTRREYRLYYTGNEVTAQMQEGDAFFIAMRRDRSAMIIVTPDGSTIYNQLLWLFGMDNQTGFSFVYQNVAGNNDAELDFAARCVLEALNIDPLEPEADRLDSLIEPFGLVFPTTKVFSSLARSSLPHVSALDSPDEAIVTWMNQEELLFRRLERRVVAERIATGFQSADGADVDGFIKFSLSVQNKRKSRAGLALENHLEEIFVAHRLEFDRGAETENGNRPDFLFPGRKAYIDRNVPASRLTMLGAKSSLKDRWRQVLSEAERIPEKHLLTLEPGVSEKQTDEMATKRLQLVVPLGLHRTYRDTQQPRLMSVRSFIQMLSAKQ